MTSQQIPFYVGVDIVETQRIWQAIERHGDRILKRLFTPEEIDYCHTKKLFDHHYAARFAAKEAVVKAANPFCKLHYRQIEVVRADSGQPSVKIHGCKRLTGEEIRLSISHSRQSSVAVALLHVGDSTPDPTRT